MGAPTTREYVPVDRERDGELHALLSTLVRSGQPLHEVVAVVEQGRIRSMTRTVLASCLRERGDVELAERVARWPLSRTQVLVLLDLPPNPRVFSADVFVGKKAGSQ